MQNRRSFRRYLSPGTIIPFNISAARGTFFSTANHYIQKGCGAFLEGIHRRLLLLEKDIHILLIAHRKTVRSDLDRLPPPERYRGHLWLLRPAPRPHPPAVPHTQNPHRRTRLSRQAQILHPLGRHRGQPVRPERICPPGSEGRWQTQVL